MGESLAWYALRPAAVMPHFFYLWLGFRMRLLVIKAASIASVKFRTGLSSFGHRIIHS
jgi:hypothetical protein